MRARRLPVLKCAKSMTMGRERLVRRVGVILADLIVPGRFTMKLRGESMMRRSRGVVPCCRLAGGHAGPLCQIILAAAI